MQRYFIGTEQHVDQKMLICGDDYHHIVRVMRMEKGNQILCSLPNGKTALCEIEDITTGEVQASIVKWINNSNEMPVHVTIAQGLPKGDKLEYIVQKGTELGAYSFLPFEATRSIVKWDAKKADKKVERLVKIAKEAAEQAHRNVVPTINRIHSFKELLSISDSYDIKIIAYEEDAKEGKHSELATQLQCLVPGQSVLVVFGPEGGLTEGEVTKLREHGFKSVSLGPRILRAETAPFYLLSAISYHIEIMR